MFHQTAAPHRTRTVGHLLLFAVYLAMLWAVGWYSLHRYGGAYSTAVTDTLLSLAFAAAFFLPLLFSSPRARQRIAALTLALAAAAALTLFLLQPRYTALDGAQMLSAARYEDVHLSAQSAARQQGTVFYHAMQQGREYSLQFDLSTGQFHDAL